MLNLYFIPHIYPHNVDRDDFICFTIYGVRATLQSLLHRNFGNNQQKQREFSQPLEPQNLKFHKRVD